MRLARDRSANPTFKLYSKNSEFPELVVDSVFAAINENNMAFYSPMESLSDLPFFDLIDDEVERCCHFLRVLSDELEIEQFGFVALCCTTACCSYYTSSVFSSKDNDKEFDLIVFDARIVYECIAFCLTTPFSHTAADEGRALAVVQMALATRLNSLQDSNLNKLVLGLTASARDRYTNKIETATDLVFDELVRKSHMKTEKIQLMVRFICRFVLYHELAHLLLSRSVETKSGLDESFSRMISGIAENIDHLQEHDAEFEEIRNALEFDSWKFASAEETVSRLLECTDDSRSVFSKYDREEMVCDFFALGNTFAAFSSDPPDDAESLMLIQVALRCCHLLVNDLSSHVNAFRRYTEYVEQFEFVPDTIGPDDSKNVAWEEFQKARQKTFSLRLGRGKFFWQMFQAVSREFREVGFKALASDHETHLPIQETEQFMMIFEQLAEKTLFSFLGMSELSSRGRALELFMNAIDVPLRVDADPLFLYLFKKIPVIEP